MGAGSQEGLRAPPLARNGAPPALRRLALGTHPLVWVVQSRGPVRSFWRCWGVSSTRLVVPRHLKRYGCHTGTFIKKVFFATFFWLWYTVISHRNPQHTGGRAKFYQITLFRYCLFQRRPWRSHLGTLQKCQKLPKKPRK